MAKGILDRPDRRAHVVIEPARQRGAQVGRRRFALVTFSALIVILGGWVLARTYSSDPAPTTVSLPTCPLATLPPEVVDTLRRIHAGGPFPFPRSDGVMFANREGHLPEQSRGYYHEYTVITPSARDRSLRRIVTGGAPLTNPTHYFYTGDHYDSFCLVTGAGRQ
jgi:guanyl-specific ribonuclease Sa